MFNLFQTINNFGLADIKRTKDCSGYKWSIKWLTGGDKAPFIVRKIL